MYAVIKTGGKQYRVRAGDLLVVEKLDGAPGAKVAFDEVLMIGEGADVTLGAPTVAGASVSATLVETRKSEKIKVFKKIRRQGYRRTQGHRQFQSVLRITALAGGGTRETWDGEVDLTPLLELNARARNLARGIEAAKARRTGAAPQLAHGEPVATKPVAAKAAAKKPGAPAPTPAKAEMAPAASKKAATAKPKAKATAKPAKAAPAPKKTAAKPAKADAPKAAAKKPAAKPAPAKKTAKPTSAKPAKAKPSKGKK